MGDALSEWSRDGKFLVRTLRFSGYTEVLSFADQLCRLSDQQNVIPAMHVGSRTIIVEVLADEDGIRFARLVETIGFDDDDELTD